MVQPAEQCAWRAKVDTHVPIRALAEKWLLPVDQVWNDYAIGLKPKRKMTFTLAASTRAARYFPLSNLLAARRGADSCHFGRAR
jgi:hypothetical protein